MGSHTYRGKRNTGTRNRFAGAGRLLATTALIGLGALALQGQHAAAQTATSAGAARAFNIPAQPLASALNAFGRQSGLQVTLAAATSQGVTSQAVNGSFTPQQALARMLEGTGIPFRITADRTAVIGRSEASGAAPASTDGALMLETIDVQGRGGSGAFGDYSPASSSPTAMKLDLAPRQTPATVNTANAQLIAEKGDETIYEVFENFAGVTSQGNNSDTGSNVARSIFVRGFDVSGDGPVLINGQRLYNNGTNFRSTAALERVELLRGAAGIYYGASQPGGVFNYVYKQPLEIPQYSATGRFDSFGSYGLTLDATGLIDEANTLRYRAIGDFVRNESEVDRIYEQPIGGMLALEWEPSADFKTNFTYEITDTSGVPQRNDNIRVNGQFLDVPRDFFWGHTNDYVDIRQHTAILENNWRATDWLNIRTYLAYQTSDQEHLTTRIGGRGPTLPNTPTSVGRTVHAGISDDDSLSAGVDVSGEFDTGSFNHQWLAGYGYARGSSYGGVAQCSTGGTGTCAAIAPTALDPTNHTPGAYAFRDQLFGLIGTQRNGMTDSTSTDHNLYVQDLITLPNDRTKLLLGVGFTAADRESYARRTDTGAVTESALDASHVTPRLAITHDLTDTTTLYASYSQSYYPQLHINPDNAILDKPQVGEQYEVGFKSELFDGNALLTVALYQLEKENVLRSHPDPDMADLGYRISNGLERARGVEVELTGAVTSWWDARLAYAYTDTEIVKADSRQGERFAYVSDHSLSLWNRFRVYGDIQDAGQWSLGAGVTAYSDFDDSSGNRMPGYAIVDAGLFYEREFANGTRFKGGFRIDNLFDKVYYDRRSTADSITYGDGRKFSLSLSTTF